nr:hypothetical protein CFP56_59628 [Quercus suber]
MEMMGQDLVSSFWGLDEEKRSLEELTSALTDEMRILRPQLRLFLLLLSIRTFSEAHDSLLVRRFAGCSRA